MDEDLERRRDIWRRSRVWFNGGDPGASRPAVAAFWRRLSGEPHDDEFPAEVADVAAIERLLVAVPEWRERLGEVAALNGPWRALVAIWPELAALVRAEGRLGRLTTTHAPRTDAALNAAISRGVLSDPERFDVMATDDGHVFSWRRRDKVTAVGNVAASC